MPWTVPFQVKAFQLSQPHLGLIGISGLTLPRENVCLERLDALTPRITYHDISVLETLSLVRFVKLRNPSLRNSLNPQHQIQSSSPSSDLWTHASLSLQVLFPMAKFQLLVSRTKLIFSTSSSWPPSIPHLCHLLFLIHHAQVRLLLKMLSTDMTVLIKRLRFSWEASSLTLLLALM